MARLARALPWLTGLLTVGGLLAVDAVGPAGAQGNLDAGKSPAQIFAATCASCHRNPRELKKANAGFLRSHYTTGPDEAAVMAAYLANPNDPRNTRQPPGSNPASNRQPKNTQTTAGGTQTNAGGTPTGASKRGRQGDPKSTTAAILTEPSPPDPPPAPVPQAPAPAPKPTVPQTVLEPFEE